MSRRKKTFFLITISKNNSAAMNSIPLKLAFITGAGSGIGRASAAALSRLGVKVIATDRNLESAQQTVALLQGSEHLALEVNVTQPRSIHEALETTRKTFQTTPTIVVNSAGVTKDNFLLDLRVDEFSAIQDVNLKGTFLVMQATARRMIETGNSQGASIVNLSSIIAVHGNIGQSGYAASKAGVVALTKSASMEFGKFGIRVNAVLPGFIDTPMVQMVPEKVKDMFLNRISLGRIGSPGEVAGVVAFLASDESSYVNGASLEVTGGMR